MMISQSRLLRAPVSQTYKTSDIVALRVCIRLSKGAVQQPGNDGKVSALIVRWQNHRVLVLVGFCGHDE